MAYTYYVPFAPELYRQKHVIYRCWSHDWVSWHSGDNVASLAIVFQGYFRSKHIRAFRALPGTDGKPSAVQYQAFHYLRQYLSQHYGLRPNTFRGHCESPQAKLNCPGDDLLVLCHSAAFDAVEKGIEMPLIEHKDALSLDSWKERQAALVLFGHNLGATGPKQNGVDGVLGPLTRAAIETTEAQFKLPRDGFWDDRFDSIFKLYLQSRGTTQMDIDALIA